MLSFFKKKKIVPHIRLTGVIGNAGRFKQGIDFAGQEELIKKAFSIKKSLAVAISINSPGGSPVQSHLIYDFIRAQAKKNKKKVIVFAEDVAASGGLVTSNIRIPFFLLEAPSLLITEIFPSADTFTSLTVLASTLTWSRLDAVKPFADLNDAGSWKTA